MSKTGQPRARPGLREYERALRAILTTSPVAYHASVGKALHSATAGVFLCQLLYWQPRGHNPDGWIWKTREEIYEETALTRYEQEGARKVLVSAGVLEEDRRGVPARMHFRIDLARLVELLDDYHDQTPANGARTYREPMSITPSAKPTTVQLGGKPPTSRGKTRQPVGENPANKKVENPPTTSETTSENTQKSTHHHTTRHVTAPETASPGSGDDDDMLTALVERGVTRGVARRLVVETDPETVRLQIERHDRLKAAESRLLSRNPAGYLRRSIEEDYPEPTEHARLVEQDAKRHHDAELAKLVEYEAWQREQNQLRDDALWQAEDPAERARRRVEQHADMLQRIKRPAMSTQEREEHYRHLVGAYRDQAVVFFGKHPELADWAHEQLAETAGDTVPEEADPASADSEPAPHQPAKSRPEVLSEPAKVRSKASGRSSRGATRPRSPVPT